MKAFSVRNLSTLSLLLLSTVGALTVQAQPSLPLPLGSGTYLIHSGYLNDNRCVDLDTGTGTTITLQMCSGAGDRKFTITRQGDGTYTIIPVNQPSKNIYYIGFAENSNPLVAAGNFPNMRWNIATAQGQPAGSKMANITLAHTVIGAASTALLWNRIDNSDGNFNGQLQLMKPGGIDPHNNWWFSTP